MEGVTQLFDVQMHVFKWRVREEGKWMFPIMFHVFVRLCVHSTLFMCIAHGKIYQRSVQSERMREIRTKYHRNKAKRLYEVHLLSRWELVICVIWTFRRWISFFVSIFRSCLTLSGPISVSVSFWLQFLLMLFEVPLFSSILLLYIFSSQQSVNIRRFCPFFHSICSVVRRMAAAAAFNGDNSAANKSQH